MIQQNSATITPGSIAGVYGRIRLNSGELSMGVLILSLQPICAAFDRPVYKGGSIWAGQEAYTIHHLPS